MQGCVVIATLTLRDGTRCLTRGAGSNRDQAEQAAALLLCEHPGVRRNLAKVQNHAKRKNSEFNSMSIDPTSQHVSSILKVLRRNSEVVMKRSMS